MGCDIHMMAEIKSRGGWSAVGRIFKSSRKEIPTMYYDKDSFDSLGEWGAQYSFEPYDGRNYTLFGFLADVRNGYGFAGIDTGDAIKPISEPRGVPKDASGVFKAWSEYWSPDAHSHSWFTLKELLDADWNQEITKRGVVTEQEYKIFKKNGKPQEWSVAAMGRNIITISESHYKDLIREEGVEYRIQIEWKEKLSEYCKDFIKSIKQLEKLGSPEEVRIVFFFDN